MQSPREFIQQYFEERVVEEKREQASRAPFRQKFHTDDCRWDSRAGTLEMIQSEKILSLSSSDTTAEVITSREAPSRPIDGLHQLRYNLQRTGDRWLIKSVDVWCYSCHGVASHTDCIFCQGTGWLDGKLPKQGRSGMPPYKRF